MKIIKPWVELAEIDGIKIMKSLERAAKHCRSEERRVGKECGS